MTDRRFTDEVAPESGADEDRYWFDAMVGLLSLLVFAVVLFVAAFRIDGNRIAASNAPSVLTAALPSPAAPIAKMR